MNILFISEILEGLMFEKFLRKNGLSKSSIVPDLIGPEFVRLVGDNTPSLFVVTPEFSSKLRRQSTDFIFNVSREIHLQSSMEVLDSIHDFLTYQWEVVIVMSEAGKPTTLYFKMI